VARGARLWMVTVDRPPAQRAVEVVAASLAEELGVTATSLTVPNTPQRRWGRKPSGPAFVATPDALMASWWFSEAVRERTAPGDTVVVSDAGGLPGLLALREGNAGPSRRAVVVVAGDGAYLRQQDLAGTAPLDEALASQVDWELASYRSASRVCTVSPFVAHLLAEVGVTAELVATPRLTGSRLAPPVTAIHCPEPVSRAARTGEVLRAVHRLRRDGVETTVSVSEVDEPDEIWTGTSWEALAGIRDVLEPALTRTAAPLAEAVLVLGDRLMLPDPATVRAIEAGQSAVVAAGSPAAARYPDLPSWTTGEDLAGILTGAPTRPPREPTRVRTPRPGPRPERATQVSVGIPVFRDVRYLDACVRSLLRQEQRPAEILLIDDGSESAEVDAALARWAQDEPDLVRILSQSNLGVCAARNTALAAMTGDAFVFVDQDDELDPRFIAACAEALRANPELVAVATWTEFFGTYEGVEAKPPFDARVGRRENPIVSTCVLVDQAVRDAGIRFAPDLAFVYCEDWDFWSQIVAAGGRFGLVPEPLARHRVHPSSGGHRRTDLALALGKARATSHLDHVDAEGPLSPVSLAERWAGQA
jgi:hypothetical protein